MTNYHAFGLYLTSEIELPSLLKAPCTDGGSDRTVTIELGEIGLRGLEQVQRVSKFVYATAHQLWLQVPNIAWFHITNGNRIRVMPTAGADEQSIQVYVLGSCMGAIMHQRSQLVLHGSALRTGNQAVIFVGNSGNGKSTLAAALYQRGYEVLADDLSVINAQGLVQPGYPQLKMWRDTATKLGINVSGLNRVRPQVDKYVYRLKTGFCASPLSVAAVYVLNTHNQDEFKLEPLTGLRKFAPLQSNTYRLNHIKGLGLSGQHLKLCGRLATQIQVTRIIRPKTGFKLGELVALIESDWQEAGVVDEVMA